MTRKSLKEKIPAPDSLDEIQEKLAPFTEDPAATAVFFDLDGTLAAIKPKPEAVTLPQEVARLIRKIEHRYLAVTVVSGRPATAAKRIVGNSQLAYIGNHGFETMLPGRTLVVAAEAQPYIGVVRELLEYVRSLPDMVDSGIMLEDKTVTMSFHYRRAPDPDRARALIQEKLIPKIEELGLRAREGRKVLEVRPPVPIDKGVAVGRLLDQLGALKAIYAGDDTTDIDALKELAKRKRRKHNFMAGIGVISDEMPAELPRYCDLLVDRLSGMELVLQILADEEL